MVEWIMNDIFIEVLQTFLSTTKFAYQQLKYGRFQF